MSKWPIGVLSLTGREGNDTMLRDILRTYKYQINLVNFPSAIED